MPGKSVKKGELRTAIKEMREAGKAAAKAIPPGPERDAAMAALNAAIKEFRQIQTGKPVTDDDAVEV